MKDAADAGKQSAPQDLTEQERIGQLEQAGRLSAHLQAAREEEQIRIARELHDDLGQQLTALKMTLAHLETALSELAATPDGEPDAVARVRAHTRDMHRLVDAMIASVRRIAAGLRPAALETLGLVAALEELVDDFMQRSGVAVRARLDADADADADADMGADADETSLSEAAETALFHIVQEALTNVARHARANQVSIELARDGSAYLLRIEDDGQGAAPDAPAKTRSFGLLGMRERVHRLDGTLTIDSAPGRGFRLVVALPFESVRRRKDG